MQVVGAVASPPADGDRVGVHAHLGAQGRDRLGDAAGPEGVGERGDEGRALGQRPFLQGRRGGDDRRPPLAGFSTPADVAAAVGFLASDDARFITGVILPVDGGITAGSGQPSLF